MQFCTVISSDQRSALTSVSCIWHTYTPVKWEVFRPKIRGNYHWCVHPMSLVYSYNSCCCGNLILSISYRPSNSKCYLTAIEQPIQLSHLISRPPVISGCWKDGLVYTVPFLRPLKMRALKKRMLMGTWWIMEWSAQKPWSLRNGLIRAWICYKLLTRILWCGLPTILQHCVHGRKAVANIFLI